MRKFVMFLMVLIFISTNVLATELTVTGFYYPTGTSNLGNYSGWLASGCNGNDDYFPQEYHIGTDIQASLGDLVYVISDGVVMSVSPNGWGSTNGVSNKGVIVKHKLHDGNYFVALYGHIQTTVIVGERIFAGEILGTIGYWPYGIHLHFGAMPFGEVPPSPWGRMACSNWPSTNGFVDPINWITSRYPYPNVGHFSNSSRSETKAFVDKYKELLVEGHNLGDPWDNGPGDEYVHEVNGMLIQDFQDRRDQGGESNGFYHPYTALIMGPNGVKLLKEGFWDYWMNHHGWFQIGAPVDDEDVYQSNDFVYQHFDLPDGQYVYHSYLLWDNSSITLNDMNQNQSYERSWVTVVNSNVNKASVDGVYHSEISVADFDEAFKLIQDRSYNGLYVSVGDEDILIDEFTVTGDMTIDIADMVQLDFSVSRNIIGTCDCVAFAGQVDVPVDSWYWDFGDGESSTRQNPGHTYHTQGSYDVTLTVSNQDGSFSEIKENYIVVGECLVNMSANVTTGELPLVVQFTGTSPGSPTFWAWDFGDGDIVFEQNPIHIYQEPGVYTVEMAVLYADDSALIVRENYITVSGVSEPSDPMAFRANVTSGSAPLQVNFTNKSTIEPIIWYWGFGDGSYFMGRNASHVYTSPGSYSVTLYAFMPSMETLVYENYINVGVDKQASVTSLNGNYPNPFNPSTTINFSLDKSQQVDISIYDVSGRRITRLVDQVFEAGAHSVQWLGKNQSGQSVSSGIYFVQMKTSKGVELKKITLIK